MKNRKMRTSFLAILLLLAGCGAKNEQSLKDRTMANTPDNYTPITAILGENPDLDTESIDTDTAQEQIADDAPVSNDKDYVGGTMALFLPTVMANGVEIKATYTITTADANASVVMSDVKSGKEVEISPGVYDITFTTKEIAGNPETTLRGVELLVGRRLSRNVKFPVGEITLVTGGKGCATAAIKIKVKGATDWLPGKYSTCKPIKLMAGEYEAKQGVTEISGITVYDGGTRKVTIRK
ncbi:MAG: hypothetical protein JXR91_13560 [Deltaproteobacteria bacterium]|nr:hypothetical protein [Deltaproteobacteria bacterium]